MKTIKYSEPNDFFPKEIRDKYFGKQEKKPAKKATKPAKKTDTKKKPK